MSRLIYYPAKAAATAGATFTREIEMRETPSRPGGISLLAGVHVVTGACGAVAGIALAVVGPLTGLTAGGVPLEWLIVIALCLLGGVGYGIGLWNGRAWAWWLGTSGYLVGCVLTVLAVLRWITGRQAPRPPFVAVHEAITTLAAALGMAFVLGVGVPAYLYLFRRPVRAHFGIDARSTGSALAAQFAIAVVLVIGLVLTAGSGDAERRLVRLHQIGSGAGAGGETEAHFLIERLREGNVDERAAAAWAIGQAKLPSGFEPLLRSAREDPDGTVRLNAVEALAAFDDEGLVAALPGFLDDPDEQIRAAALRGLADPRFAGSVDAVGAVLVDGPPALHALAADVLGRMASERGIPFLERAAGNPDADVRSRVAFALGKLRARAALPTLLRLLKDESWEVRANTAQALGWIGEPSARPALTALLDDPDRRVRGVADKALAELP